MAEVLVIGIAVVDFVLAVDPLPDKAQKYFAPYAEIVGGGCAANAAVAVARLGGTARLGARLGDDQLGDLILSDLVSEGVDTSLVQRAAGGRSSFSSVLVDRQGERQIVNFRGEGLSDTTDWIGTVPAINAVLADTRWTPGALSALKLARDRGIPGVLDAEAPVDEALALMASHVAFSRTGLAAFTDEADLKTGLRKAAANLPGWVCVTDGADGVYWMEADILKHIAGFSVEARDTLGAGDIWHGAFALALAEGQREPEAVQFANAAAALKCTTFGGRKGCPDRVAVTDFLKEYT